MANEVNRIVLTPEGKRKLEEELMQLKSEERKKIADEIRTARGFGDLSENSEYDEAKNAQARMETRVRQIEEMLRDCVVVDETQSADNVATVGCSVRVMDKMFNEEDVYTIVGATEGDPARLHVSTESPIGQALIGAHVGDIVAVRAPIGTIEMEVLEIFRK